MGYPRRGSNAHLDDPTAGVPGRVSCYVRRADKICLTHRTTGPGDEIMSASFGLLDLTVYGRRKEGKDSRDGWPHSRPIPSCPRRAR
jgi:hypothetical protein